MDEDGCEFCRMERCWVAATCARCMEEVCQECDGVIDEICDECRMEAKDD